MQLHHLDSRTRALMHDEVQLDISLGRLFLSSRLSPAGCAQYPSMLLNAIASGNADSFTVDLARARGLFNTHEVSYRRGVPHAKAVPYDAPAMLAEGEFNRFYLRALCVRAEQDGIDSLEIYRAKVVYTPRWDSEARIGKLIEPAALLRDLRANIGINLALGVPNGPNSGLSARLPSNANFAATDQSETA